MDDSDFQDFLDQGGHGLLDQSRAQREAMRRQKIRSGEISFSTIVDLVCLRVARLRSMTEAEAPEVLLELFLESVEEGVDELRISLESRDE